MEEKKLFFALKEMRQQEAEILNLKTPHGCLVNFVTFAESNCALKEVVLSVIFAQKRICVS